MFFFLVVAVESSSFKTNWFYEILQIINALKAENNILNTKLRRVEGENVLKVSSEYIYYHVSESAAVYTSTVSNP